MRKLEMKNSNLLFPIQAWWVYCSLLLVGTSCVDYIPLTYEVEKPESIALQESLSDYGHLKSYIDSVANPNFRFGTAVSASDYLNQGVKYRLINNNFNQISISHGINHQDLVQSDGTILQGDLEGIASLANEAGTEVMGPALVWHRQQNVNYLNALLSPLIINSPPFVNELDIAALQGGSLENWESSGDGSIEIRSGEGMGSGSAIEIHAGSSASSAVDVRLTTPEIPIVQGRIYEIVVFIKSETPGQGRLSFEGLTDNTPEMDWTSSGEFREYFNTDLSWKEIRVRVSDFEGDSFKLKFDLGYQPDVKYFVDIPNLYIYDTQGDPIVNNLIANGDFEDGVAWGGWGNDSERGVTPDGGGAGNTGRALFVQNPSLTGGFWEVQTLYELGEFPEEGETYQLSFWVRGDAEGVIRPELQSPDFSSDGFGQVFVTEDWTLIELSTTVSAPDRGRFIISYGEFAGTVYMDDFVLSSASATGGGSTTIVDRTPEEKEVIISGQMENWIATLVSEGSASIHAWDVVVDPLNPDNPSEVRTSNGSPGSNEFYWQDYMGRDYAVRAFEFARQNVSNGDLLFISDYGLEENLEKCRELIAYIDYIENHGGTVDGIGVNMDLNLNSNRENIMEMFELLANTGKLVKISGLSVGLNSSSPSWDEMELQADMYQYVLEAYQDRIPGSQQFGITLNNPTDDSNGQNGFPGLWTHDLNRKPAYVGIVEGLQNF